MTLKFKPFEPFEIPETLRVEMTFEVSLDHEGDVVVEDAEGDVHVYGPEQWKLLTERVQVEDEPEPWERVRDILRTHLRAPLSRDEEDRRERAVSALADLFKSRGA